MTRTLSDICIVSARRTPFGRFLGSLAKLSAVELAVAAGGAALENIGAAAIDLTVVGSVLAAGQGMNAARQIALKLGVALDRPAFTVNMVCGSGMQAVILAAQAVQLGEARAVLCGGTESMSNAPYLLDRARSGLKFGHGELIDAILRDGLADPFSGELMGVMVERLAAEHGVTRQAQDEFALRSQQRYGAAAARGAFHAELVPLDQLDHDEHPRPDTTAQKLASLAPAFKPDGTVTAGNASGINDGAAMMVVCDAQTAQERGWPVLARIEASACVGCDPERWGLGPIDALRQLCQRADRALEDFETVEINEAFAAQALVNIRELALDEERVNPNGSAIALGHPIGASGARLVAHLAHRIAKGEITRAAGALCVGGGMGVAMALTAE